MKNTVSFFVEKTSNNVKKVVDRTRIQAILYAVLGITALMLLFGLSVAFFFSLATYFSLLQASWIMVGIWLAIFFIIFGVTKYITQKKKDATILPTLPGEQKQLLTSSAISALFWIGRKSPLLKYAASVAGIASLFKIIKGIDNYERKPYHNRSNFH